ncbi:MAG: hypothetical protein ACI8VC_000483 [Candidatus Endobugula sp.]|jgi:hypothetical protein
MTLRTFQTTLAHRLSLLKDIFFNRTIDELMRSFFGKKWNNKNEKRAI